MSLRSTFARAAKAVWIPATLLLLAGYLGYHAYEGERGWLAQQRLVDRIAVAEHHLATVVEERQALAQRVEALAPGTLDRDLLDQQARLLLGYGRPDELLLYVRP